MAQDNEVKKPAFMPTPENTAGNESGVSTLIPGATYNKQADQGINGTASGENLSAKWKSGAQDVPEAGKNQYQ